MQKYSEDIHRQRLMVIRRWEESGKPVHQFCKDEKINYNTFHYWRKRIKKENPGRFIKLQPISTPFPETKFCELFFTNGTRILFHQAPPADFVKKLLR